MENTVSIAELRCCILILNHIGIRIFAIFHTGLQNIGAGVAVVMTGEDHIHACLVELRHQFGTHSDVGFQLASFRIPVIAGAIGRLVINSDGPVKGLTGGFFVDNPVDEFQMFAGIGSRVVIGIGIQHQEQNIVINKVIVCACEVCSTGIGSAIVGAIFLGEHIGQIDVICIDGIGIIIMVARYGHNGQTQQNILIGKGIKLIFMNAIHACDVSLIPEVVGMGVSLVTGRYQEVHAGILDLTQSHAPMLSLFFQVLIDQVTIQLILVAAAADLGVTHKGEAEVTVCASLEALQLSLVFTIDQLIVISGIGLQAGNGGFVVHIAGLLIIIASGCFYGCSIFRQLTIYQLACLSILDNTLSLALREPGEVHLGLVSAQLQKDVSLSRSGLIQIFLYCLQTLCVRNGYIGNHHIHGAISSIVCGKRHAQRIASTLAAAGLLCAGALRYQAAVNIVLGGDIIAEDILRIGKFYADMVLAVNSVAGIFGYIAAYGVIPVTQLHDTIYLVKANHEGFTNIASFHGRILVTECDANTTLTECTARTGKQTIVRNRIKLDVALKNSRCLRNTLCLKAVGYCGECLAFRCIYGSIHICYPIVKGCIHR